MVIMWVWEVCQVNRCISSLAVLTPSLPTHYVCTNVSITCFWIATYLPCQSFYFHRFFLSVVTVFSLISDSQMRMKYNLVLRHNIIVLSMTWWKKSILWALLCGDYALLLNTPQITKLNISCRSCDREPRHFLKVFSHRIFFFSAEKIILSI